MELNSFTRKIAECFHEADTANFTPDTNFKNMDEWGSMLALIVIAMIDADYNTTITADDLKKANTIKDLFQIVLVSEK